MRTRRATQGRVYPHLRGNRLGREPRSAAAGSSCPWSDPGSWTGPCFTPRHSGRRDRGFGRGSGPPQRGHLHGSEEPGTEQCPRTSKRRKKATTALARPRYSAVHCCESSPHQEQQTPQNRYSNTEIEGVTSSAPALASIHPLTHSATGAEIALFGTAERFRFCCFSHINRLLRICGFLR